MATTFDQMLGTGIGPTMVKGGVRVDSVFSTAINTTPYQPRGLGVVDHEAIDQQRLKARWLTWERARSAPPAACDSPAACEPPESNKPNSRLRRLANRVKGKFQPNPEEVAAVELADKISAEKSAAADEYPGVYENSPDVLVEDCNSERGLVLHHENYGPDDEYEEALNHRAELGAMTTAPPTFSERMTAWGNYYPQNGVWDDPNKPLPGEDQTSHDDLHFTLQTTERNAPPIGYNKYAARGASRTIMQAKRVARKYPGFAGGIDRFVRVC